MKHSHAATGKAAALGAGWLTSVSTRPTTLPPSTATPASPSPPSVRTGTTADEREETRDWLARITAPPDGIAKDWAEQIGSRLLDLSITAVESPPFFTILDTWTATSPDEQRLRIVTALITRAAETEELARAAHKQLLDWATKGYPHRRRVVAQACSGRYGMRWPHMAFVRLRHILAADDEAAASPPAPEHTRGRRYRRVPTSRRHG